MDDLKVNSRQGSYKARFELNVPPSPTGLTKEHCRANREQIKNILRRHRGEQIRIEFRTANGGTISAICTVKTFHNDRNLVSLGDKIQNQLSNCQLSNSNTCEGEVKAQLMIDGLNEDKAKEISELIECLSQDGQNRKLVVIAPHGGEIEEYTDKQAEYVESQFSSDRVSLWTCKGFSSEADADAFERWHITSTEIREK